MPELFSWSLGGLDQPAYGIVSGHSRLWEGVDIHTSRVLRAEEGEEELLLETASGNLYRLRLREWCGPANRPDLSPPPPEELGLSPDFWERCARERERAAREEERESHAPGTLRLRVVGPTVLTARWSGPSGQTWNIPFIKHIGMFQVSILLRTEPEDERCRLDFRYFHFPDWMEPYVSEGVKTILIVNEGLRDVRFGREGSEVLCPAGAETEIDAGN